MARSTSQKTKPATEAILAPNPAPAELFAAVEGGASPFMRVTGPEKGRRRAGRRFGPEAVDVPVADLTEAEILSLQEDPLLVISYGVLDPSDAPDEGAST